MLHGAALPVVALLGSAGATAALGWYAWGQRQVPGARPFAGLLAALTVWSVCSALTLLSRTRGAHILWERAQWLGIAFVPVFWLLFAAAYTGQDGFVSRRSVGLLSAVPAASVVLVFTNHWHHLVWRTTVLTVEGGLPVAGHTYGPWFYLNLVFAYTLIGIASFMLVRLAVVSEALYADQSALLVVGTLVPLSSNAVSVLGVLPLPGFDLTPFAFAVTGLAFGYALFRRRLLELVPATRRIGRDAAIATLEDGVVILDADRRVVYLNAAAECQLDCAAADALGEPVEALLDTASVGFDGGGAGDELHRGDRVYELRTSEITDRTGRRIGHTLLVSDVTGRKRRERRLRRQRDELVRLDRLNAAIRGVNRALVGAEDTEALAAAVCDRLVDSGLYDTARVVGAGGDSGSGDVAPDSGDDSRPADPGAVARADAGGTDPDAAARPQSPPDGGRAPDAPLTWRDAEAPPEIRSPESVVAEHEADPGADAAAGLRADSAGPDGPEPSDAPVGRGPDDGTGRWTLVPLRHDRTVHGGLLLHTTRPDAFGERELAVLGELGGLLGHAIDATERRRLLSADAVLELEFVSTDSAPAAFTAGDGPVGSLALEGFVPADEGVQAYFRATDAPVDALSERLADRPDTDASVVTEDGSAVVLEWELTGDAALVPLVAAGAHVRTVTAADGECRTVAEVAPDADLRSLVERVRATCPAATLARKREREGPVDRAVAALPDESIDGLTDRQREALEAAYRAGYFEWPRESTAEEVADSLDISPPTLHAHLRKAEGTLLAALFGDGADERYRDAEG